MMTTMMMMARSCHTAQFGRCELVGGGLAWHPLQHDDDDDDDGDDGDDGDDDGGDDCDNDKRTQTFDSTI